MRNDGRLGVGEVEVVDCDLVVWGIVVMATTVRERTAASGTRRIFAPS